MILPWILFSLVCILLCISLYYNYKFARVILRMEDAIEESLDRLDDRYMSITKILEVPLFYDSPQIRQVIGDIKECRQSILFVANQIGRIEEVPDGEEKTQEDK